MDILESLVSRQRGSNIGVYQELEVQFEYYPRPCSFGERQRFQKNRPHPPELAAGNNTSTTFHEPARRKVCGFSLAHIPVGKELTRSITLGKILPFTGRVPTGSVTVRHQ